MATRRKLGEIHVVGGQQFGISGGAAPASRGQRSTQCPRGSPSQHRPAERPRSGEWPDSEHKSQPRSRRRRRLWQRIPPPGHEIYTDDQQAAWSERRHQEGYPGSPPWVTLRSPQVLLRLSPPRFYPGGEFCLLVRNQVFQPRRAALGHLLQSLSVLLRVRARQKSLAPDATNDKGQANRKLHHINLAGGADRAVSAHERSIDVLSSHQPVLVDRGRAAAGQPVQPFSTQYPTSQSDARERSSVFVSCGLPVDVMNIKIESTSPAICIARVTS